MDRGRKQDHIRFSQNDSGTRRNQETADRSLGLRTLRRPIEREKPLLLFQEYRFAKSERGLYHGQFFRKSARAARSKCARQRWDDRVGRHGCDRRRQTDGLRSRYRRLRLATMESARRRDRQRSTRSSRLDQVFEHIVEKRWKRIFLQPL